ncbi:MAG: phage tail tube protein [Actinomycetota bacterium]|nr:phage tail tube protein [Actinomycetota bacterium]
MTTASGFDSQCGYAVESPSGTFTAPTRAIEHVKSGLKSTRLDTPSKGIKAGRRGVVRMIKGVEVVAGSIVHELSPANTGVILVQGMGAVSTSGSGTYTHVITPGPLVEERTMSVQVGTPSYDGTVRPFNFSGCQIQGFSIDVNAGADTVMLNTDWVGQHMQSTGDGDTVAALTAASYSSAWSPFSGLQAVLSIAGDEYEFDTLSFSAKNGLRTGNYTARSTTPGRAKLSKEQDPRRWTCAVKSDFWDLTVLNRAFAGTEVAFSLALTAGSTSLTLAGNVHTQVESPTVEGTSLIKDALNLEFLSPSVDASACTFTLVNADSAP